MTWYDITFMKMTDYLQSALKYLIILFSPNRIQEQRMYVGSKRVYGLIMCSLVSSRHALEAFALDNGNF